MDDVIEPDNSSAAVVPAKSSTIYKGAMTATCCSFTLRIRSYRLRSNLLAVIV